ncbi:enoyl-CoA hydratase/isomerase family protein [Mycolicibacterium hodleri]|uniref:enoyl-CoA hydratase/isomerase family protein n=1 Tax=Mycolicibacterium hodleri TaxID=49897 RepID=UPI0022A73FC5|nr:enoyl-CoA hydratase/isomerase family protein [Mycolicibacterium hodleri]
MSDQPHAVFETVGHGIARIRINRPDRLGAYTPRMCAEILEGIRRLRLDDSLRVLILTGTGRGFCTGGDVSPDAGFADDLTKQIGRAGTARRLPRHRRGAAQARQGSAVRSTESPSTGV